MLGLTLEGGGAKGSYQIGAWKAFREMNIEFDGITGTSVGALNGALMLQDDFDLAYGIWHEMNPNTIMDIDDRIYEMLSNYQLTANNVHFMLEQVRKFIKGFGMDTKPLEQLIEANINEGKIRKASTDFGFVTVSLTDFKPLEIFKEEIPMGKMADYLMASSYLPIFKSKKLDGKTFLDGGFYNNLPINMLYEKGYRKIVAVRLLSKGRVKKVEHHDLDVLYIQPCENLGNMMDFSNERAQTNLNLGYFDTLRACKGLKGRKYYIEGFIDEITAMAFLMRWDEAVLKNLSQLFGLSASVPLNRLLLEEIIPRWIHLMDLSEKATYQEVAIAILENMAHYLKINRFEVYSLASFVEEIRKHKERMGETERPIHKNNLLSEELILKISKEKQLEASIKIMLENNGNIYI
ncbi:Patatin [Alkaliphilus metalliredigens QYMF]|uniref:Patatin n=1 Tax=Alkaliphilus metalliredigens (strain QYMF) TaxID=293826 RepID=A6TX08_ALKMQ|nr:patatin-like phospholipase family protein [Alkaliphilus metalliredigens]ABR50726.1 Patatin [Alkaliphilus metalliredigens QYMF]